MKQLLPSKLNRTSIKKMRRERFNSKIILGWWKIVNTKEKSEKELFKDDLRGPIESHGNGCGNGRKNDGTGKRAREKVNNGYWDGIFQNVCRGMINLSHDMLNAGNDYVILGWLTTDPM